MRAQVRRKISASGLPVSSIAETETVWKYRESPRSSSSRGRYESQFDTTASGSPRAASASSVGTTSG